jgi:uncharacterized protein
MGERPLDQAVAAEPRDPDQAIQTARPAPPDAPGPVGPAERIAPLDVLRGFALLGILVMNIRFFAMPVPAYNNPTAYGSLEGANDWVWYLGDLLADTKFMTIFSMLFGAGIVLMAGRQEAAFRRPGWLHYRRMAVLLAFGLAHAYLLWGGDILYTYALCGMAVYPLRRLRPRWLLALGLLLLAVGSAINLAAGAVMSFLPPEALDGIRRGFHPSADVIDQELAAYRGGWVDGFRQRWPLVLGIQTLGFALMLFWRAGGLMLVGMGLFKLGVFSAALSRRAYLMMLALGLLVGLPVTAYGLHQDIASGWDAMYVKFVGQQYNYWASLLVAGGWVGLVMLVCQSDALRPATTPLAAVGRMAFTNYLMQTVICTTLFYGYGFGLFGYVDRVGQFGIVLAVWAFQLIVSPLWLRYFRLGPAEWLWRSLTYMRLQPILAGGAAEPADARPVETFRPA